MKEGLNPEINKPTGENLNDGKTGNGSVDANSYKAVAVGSVLTLDNVKLGYADAATVTAAPRRNNKNK